MAVQTPEAVPPTWVRYTENKREETRLGGIDNRRPPLAPGTANVPRWHPEGEFSRLLGHPWVLLYAQRKIF